MTELLRTNDIVLISFLQALLDDAGIASMVFDQHSSAIEGSIGVVPRRLLVVSDTLEAARRLVADAGHAAELP